MLENLINVENDFLDNLEKLKIETNNSEEVVAYILASLTRKHKSIKINGASVLNVVCLIEHIIEGFINDMSPEESLDFLSTLSANIMIRKNENAVTIQY